MSWLGKKAADVVTSGQQLVNGTVTAVKLAAGAVVAHLGYTPVNKAGDTMSGPLQVSDSTFNSAVRLTNTGAGGQDWYLFSTMNSFTQGGGKLMAYNGGNGHPYDWAIDSSGRVTMPYQPAFYLYNNAVSGTISNNVYTKVALNATSFDAGSNCNTTLNRFTAPVSGKYLLCCHVKYTQNANNSTFIATFAVNGNINESASSRFYSPGVADNRGIYMMTSTILVSLAAGDYVEMFGACIGSTANFDSGSSLSGYLVG